MDQIDKIKIINNYKVKLLNKLNDDIDKDEIIKSWQKFLYKGYVSSSRPNGDKFWDSMNKKADEILTLPVEEIKSMLLPDDAMKKILDINNDFHALCFMKIDGKDLDRDVNVLIDEYNQNREKIREFNKEKLKKYETIINGCIDYLLYDKTDNLDSFLLNAYNLKKNGTINGKKMM